MSNGSSPIAMLDLQREVRDLGAELREAVDRVLSSGQFVGGPEVDAFEQEVANYLGVNHAVALNSGTDALVLALEALDIGSGDEVITTPFTFFATAEAIMRVGAIPRFADIDPLTLNIDPDTVVPLINERTRALLPVHLFGLPANMAALTDLANEHGLRVLEDAAQAFGARYDAPCAGCDDACSHAARGAHAGKMIGSIGDVGAFSFYPTKTLGAYGDGGMLTTSHDDVAERVRRLRNHGSRPEAKYINDILGHNSRLDAVQAAVLRLKLPRLEASNAARRSLALAYREAFTDTSEVIVPPDHPSHVYHQYTVQIPATKASGVRASLDADGIAHQHFYPISLSEQPALAHLTERFNDPVPVTRDVCSRVLSLPIHPHLQTSDVERIAQRVKDGLRDG